MKALIERLIDNNLVLEQVENGWILRGEQSPDLVLMHDIRVALGVGLVDFKQLDSDTLQQKISELRRTNHDQVLEKLGTEFSVNRGSHDEQWANIKSPDDEPIVQLLNSLVTTALTRNASDIHIDLESDATSIRLRIDGVLTDYMRLPVQVMGPLLGRLKIISSMDITERRRPQDGSFSVTQGPSVDIRVATLPGLRSERAVLRIFQSVTTRIGLSALGISESQTDGLMQALANQSGLILICGPTGSGKTTTIYSILETMKGRGLNIMTIEDPVEVEIDGIVQSQVNLAVGYDFQSGLRALLRQDPDVLLVGEIRDRETADAAIRAALTGHMVIATVHANSVAGAVNRLIDLGVDRTLVADALVAIFNQRLVRTYCQKCAPVSVQSRAHLSSIPVLFDGCDHCYHTGFQGRLPVMEHIVLNHEQRADLMQTAMAVTPAESLLDAANELFVNRQIPRFEVCRVGGLDSHAISV